MDGFLVKRPGFLTTVQDKGRFGYQWSGLSPAGAMDLHSMRLANLLVGNDMDEAALEITIIGPTLEFHANAVIALLELTSHPFWMAFRFLLIRPYRCAAAPSFPLAPAGAAAAVIWPLQADWIFHSF